MTCQTIQPELIGYHFGLSAPEAREGIERHLVGCTSCLQEFLSLKRAVETSELEPAPSDLVRLRVRAAVARELAGPEAKPWRWWERPLAFALASAVAVMAVVATHGMATGPGVYPRIMATIRSPQR